MIFFAVIFSKFCKKFRSSHQRCSIKRAVLKNFEIFTGKQLCQSPFLIKLQAFRTSIFKNTYFEKHLWTTVSVNSRAAVFQEIIALPFEWNALTSGILLQHTHSNLVGIFSQFWQLDHSWELNLLCWIAGCNLGELV